MQKLNRRDVAEIMGDEFELAKILEPVDLSDLSNARLNRRAVDLIMTREYQSSAASQNPCAQGAAVIGLLPGNMALPVVMP